MKRNSLAAIVILVLAMALAACGADDKTGNASGESGASASATGTEQPAVESAAESAATEEASSPAAETSAAPDAQRTVQSEKGEVTIPDNPQRIIGLSVVYPEFLYALGIVPLAVQNYHADFPSYLQEAFANTQKLGIARTPDFEALLAAKPDLILAPVWWADKDYDQLSKIAPTVLLPARDDWRDELRDIGTVLGKADAAEQVIADLKAQEEAAKTKLDELVGDETVVYLRIMPKEIIVHSKNIDRGDFIHNRLGLKPLDNFAEDATALSISLESLPEYDADHIIVQLDDDTNKEVMDRYELMLGSALWKNMKAFKNDHVYVVGGKEWFNLGMSPLSDSYVTDVVVGLFENNRK